MSPFRVNEINGYLSNISGTYTFSSNSGFVEHKREYIKKYPKFKNKIFRFITLFKFRPKLIYVIFLHNTYRFLSTIEKSKTPFAFELYPGGEFKLNDQESDRKLMTILSSKYFKGVITTQDITTKYLLNNKLCPRKKIHYVYGGSVPTDEYIMNSKCKVKYMVNKKTFDICFVAHKNMPLGEDKGFDLFVKSALKLAEIYSDLQFHIVGNFSGKEVYLGKVKRRFKFYGLQKTEFFYEFYSKMDMILSPNRPFTLSPGAFDGFPTGCCVEAALCGVAMVVTDELGMRVGKYIPGKNIIIIKPNIDDIVAKISKYYRNPNKLYKLSLLGQTNISKLYSTENQILKKVNILREIIANV